MITSSVVLYKSSVTQVNDLLQCIENSIIDKVFVIDNFPTNSNKELCKKYSKTEYTEHENTGYGDSHNIGLKKSFFLGADYHIVLNPDIKFESDVISVLYDYMNNNSDIGYILPKVIYPNGELQYLCKLLPTPIDLVFRRFGPNNKITNKRNDKYILKHSGYDKIMNPPCLSGCFMFLRCKILIENNLFFDNKYFMYFEDFDLIRRLHRVSKTIYYPHVKIIHDHSKESYKNPKMLRIHLFSALIYFCKYGWIFDKERKSMNRRILEEIDNLKLNQ